MSDLRTAAQQALEALDEADTFHRNLPDQRARRLAAMAALRAALAQGQAEPVEPVAWRTFDGEGGYDYRTYADNENYAAEWAQRNPRHVGWVEPLYTAPPQRKPLPKHDQHCVDVPGYGLMAVRLVRAIERAHGIKE